MPDIVGIAAQHRRRRRASSSALSRIIVGVVAHHRRIDGASSSARRDPWLRHPGRRGAAPDPEGGMAFPRPIDRRIRARTGPGSVEDAPLIAALVAAAAVPALAWALPRGLVLPALSGLLVALAFGLAALARAGPDGRPPASRYVSATLAFIGFGAALLTDPEPVLSLLEGPRRTP
jgi:hypothetical protein